VQVAFVDYTFCPESVIMELIRWSQKDDPEMRCDFIIKSTGLQCQNTRCPPSTRCPLHGANKQIEAAERKSLNMYRLAKFQARVNELKEHNDVKSLRNEIGILRMILEEKMNRASNESELILMAGPLSDLVMKIEKLVSSCQRLENSLGNLLDKQQMKNIASQLMQTLSEVVDTLPLDDETKGNILELVANKFIAIIAEQQK